MPNIKECGEPLVDLREACPRLIIDLDPQRLQRERSAYVRQTVAAMLYDAQRRLPHGMTFIVRDAWRPPSVQEEIYAQFIRWVARQHLGWSKQRVRREAATYVAPATGTYASGHLTGGAVDLRLWYRGRRLPMRSAALSYRDNAQTHQPKLPPYIRRHRQLMCETLAAVGLSNYPKEYWHWSYGDIWWAKRCKQAIAIYGVVEKPTTRRSCP